MTRVGVFGPQQASELLAPDRLGGDQLKPAHRVGLAER